MPIDLKALEALAIRDMRFVYGERDTMLYALSVGMGANPLDAAELPFVYEGAGLRAVPTMAVVLASTGIIRKTGVDFAKILHGEQRLTLHRPLPASGELLATSRVSALYDKGAEKGAVLLLETSARSADDGKPLFRFVMTIMARGDGGFGGPLYRLNADRNPLHADPEVAARAGFERPIVHGLATYGIACRAVLKAVCDYRVADLRTFDARFSVPVYPGDEIVTEIWRNADHIAFRARVPARNAIVLNNGRCTLGTSQ